ncbi:hypothetical protein HWV62_39531 [Athelia sp. TMB]|nr:hypothetical protein HWV62_39531 [Athelia sp. TMB]
MSTFAEVEASFGWEPVSSGPERIARNQSWFVFSMRRSEYLKTLLKPAKRLNVVLVDDAGIEWTPEQLEVEVEVSLTQTRWFKNQVDQSISACAKQGSRADAVKGISEQFMKSLSRWGAATGSAQELASLMPKHLKSE